jgi:Flp pilus assembly pilin Flp
MLALYVHLSTYLSAVADRIAGDAPSPLSGGDERGQASAEYALVLLGAAAVALLIVAWATKSDLVGKLLDAVMKAITDKVK